jgi:cytoskeletal protein CcmA (bactofilin family)
MTTKLDSTARFVGDVVTEEDLLVEGVVEGTISGRAAVVIAVGALVKGKVLGREVEVHGTVQGDVEASGLLKLGGRGRIEGDVRASHLSVEDGGVLHGRVL